MQNEEIKLNAKDIETPPMGKLTIKTFWKYMASEGKKRKQKLAEEMQNEKN